MIPLAVLPWGFLYNDPCMDERRDIISDPKVTYYLRESVFCLATERDKGVKIIFLSHI